MVGWASEVVRNTSEGGREYLYRWSDTPVVVVATTYRGCRKGLRGGTEYLCRWSEPPIQVVRLGSEPKPRACRGGCSGIGGVPMHSGGVTVY